MQSINIRQAAARLSPSGGTTFQTTFPPPLSFGESFMKIRSAVPENGCLIVLVDGKKNKTKKITAKHIRIRLLAEGGCVNYRVHWIIRTTAYSYSTRIHGQEDSSYRSKSAVDPGFAKGGGPWPHGECAERKPKRRSGAQPPQGTTAETLCPFSYKMGPKVEDLNENSPPCLRQTASHTTQPRPALSFGEWGCTG